MKVVHWSITNGSGLHRVAESLAKAESAAGLDSTLVDSRDASTWVGVADADVHVVHSHLPPTVTRRKDSRIVWVGHGTPDHCYQSAVEEAERGAYGHSDPLMLAEYWLKVSDARVTFWDRHAWIYDQMLTKGARPTDVVPMGVDTSFWCPGDSAGAFSGSPSLLYAENPHYIKWAYDLLTALPTIQQSHPGLMLHALYQVRDQHRVQMPWFNQLGASFFTHYSSSIFQPDGLRNAFRSTDYTVGLVRYGDLNRLSMEANACGAKTISYKGNPYSMFHVEEGDQREIAKQITAILSGEVEPRDRPKVPDIKETADAMLTIYRDIA